MLKIDIAVVLWGLASKLPHSTSTQCYSTCISTAFLDLCGRLQGIRLIELLVRAAFNSGQLNVGHRRLEH